MIYRYYYFLALWCNLFIICLGLSGEVKGFNNTIPNVVYLTIFMTCNHIQVIYMNRLIALLHDYPFLNTFS